MQKQMVKWAKVYIVGKTKAGKGLCIGGITLEGESLRLQKPDFPFWHENDGFEVGQEYELNYKHVKNKVNPHHVEDVEVVKKRLIGELNRQEIDRWLRTKGLVKKSGDPRDVFDFDGNEHPMTRDTENNYVTAPKSEVGRLRNSVGFWECPQDLTMCRHGDYGEYYFNDNLLINIKYVGCDSPVQCITAGRVIRLSTAALWSRDSSQEPISYLQLSGWF